MPEQMIKANQGDTFRCQKCGMELTITKGCDCDDNMTELKCCGQPLSRVSPKSHKA